MSVKQATKHEKKIPITSTRENAAMLLEAFLAMCVDVGIPVGHSELVGDAGQVSAVFKVDGIRIVPGDMGVTVEYVADVTP